VPGTPDRYDHRDDPPYAVIQALLDPALDGIWHVLLGPPGDASLPIAAHDIDGRPTVAGTSQ
jgi:hypothetical protein